MKLSGIEAITLPTQKSSRNTIVVSATIFFVILYEVPISDLSVFGIQVPTEFLGAVSWTLLVFSTLNHIINWFGDALSYQNWYQTNAVPLNTIDGIGETVSPIMSVSVNLHHLNKHLDDISEKLDNNSNDLGDLSKLREINDKISDAKKSFNTLHIYAKFYIFIWYLIVPIFAALIAAFTLLSF